MWTKTSSYQLTVERRAIVDEHWGRSSDPLRLIVTHLGRHVFGLRLAADQAAFDSAALERVGSGHARQGVSPASSCSATAESFGRLIRYPNRPAPIGAYRSCWVGGSGTNPSHREWHHIPASTFG